jgi:hypothetical protein
MATGDGGVLNLIMILAASSDKRLVIGDFELLALNGAGHANQNCHKNSFRV